ncbi:MAG: PilT/PilU family type 4a pilus ATPase [Planctomycetaceae bacterium]
MSDWQEWEKSRLVRAPKAAGAEAVVDEPAGPENGPRVPALVLPPMLPEGAAPAPKPRRRALPALVERRGEDRIQRILCARVEGRHGSFSAMVTNVSRTGVYLSIIDPEFDAPPEDDESGLAGLRIASHFGDGLVLKFAGHPTVVEAEVVRLHESRHEGELVFSLGCQFLRELTPEECAFLRLPLQGRDEAVQGPAAATTGATGGAGNAPAAGVPAQVVVVQGIAAPVAGAEPAGPRHVTLQGVRYSILDLLKMTVDRKATDLHLKGGSPLRFRIDGELRDFGGRPLEDAEARGLAQSLLTPEQFARFEERGDHDIGFSLEGQARFRINVLRSRGSVGMAIRRIPETIPTPKELGLAPACASLAERPRGLVLVTGPTGSGKSTTLAAMVHHVNETRRCHILTMEDPIEFLHTEIQAHITQREVGRDTRDFASALKRALRQDPNVILVGEMRDLETIALAVTAAETGHLVFATLHTTSATLSVDRIVDVFPPEQQRQVRMQLADCLQGIVCQLLLPKVGGGVVVAQEVLIANHGIRALIREGKSPQITNMMQTGAKDGMQTLEDALNDLVARGLIAYETALAKANHPRNIEKSGKPLARSGSAQPPAPLPDSAPRPRG